jgi:hypothetical protein
LGVFELYVVIMFQPMFRHHQFFWMPKPNMPEMFFYSGHAGLTSLSDVHLATFTGHAIHPWSPQPQVILHRTEEPGDFPQQQANTPDVVFDQCSANAVTCHLDIWQDSD